MVLSVFFIILGFILLIKCADLLVDGASNIAKKLGISEIIIGLTIVSIGTSMPELFVSSTSGANGFSDMAIGNIIGSNLCNLLLILGLSAIIKPVKLQKQTMFIEVPVSLVITVIFMILCNTSLKLSRIEAVILLIMFVIFITYTIIMGLKDKKEQETAQECLALQVKNKSISIWKNIIFIILGVLGLKIGGDLTVDNATQIAKFMGISEKVIGLTILAIGTSLPELVTSITAALKGNSDIAVGNIIGSNIFNILFIMGVSALISPLSYNITYNLQMMILIFAMIILALAPIKLLSKNEVNRKSGLLYMSMYIMYIGILFII